MTPHVIGMTLQHIIVTDSCGGLVNAAAGTDKQGTRWQRMSSHTPARCQRQWVCELIVCHLVPCL